MKTTIVGDYGDFATASRVAAELMVAGFAQGAISIVGRDELIRPSLPGSASRFAFAGSLAGDLTGAREDDFEPRLVAALARLCVPPRAAARHAAAMLRGGGLVAIQTDSERARRGESVMGRHGSTHSYAAGTLPMARAGRVRDDAAAALPTPQAP